MPPGHIGGLFKNSHDLLQAYKVSHPFRDDSEIVYIGHLEIFLGNNSKGTKYSGNVPSHVRAPRNVSKEKYWAQGSLKML